MSLAVARRLIDVQSVRDAVGGKWREALGLLFQVGDNSVEKDRGDLLRACAQAWQWRLAMQLLREDPAPSTEWFEHAIQARVGSNRRHAFYSGPRLDEVEWRKQRVALVGVSNRPAIPLQWPPASAEEEQDLVAVELAREALALLGLGGEGAPGSPADLLAHAAAMRLCSAAGVARWALEVFERMQGTHVQPDAACYSAAIQACRESGDWARAVRFLGEMRASAMSPSAAAFRDAARACDAARVPEMTLRVFVDSRTVGLDADTCDAAISACEQIAAYQGWIPQLFNESIQFVRAHDWHAEDAPKAHSDAFSAAITSCTRCGEWELALRLLEESKGDDGVSAAAIFNAAVRALTLGGWGELSLPLLREMDRLTLSPDSFTLHSAMLESVRTARVRDARLLYARVRRLQIAPPWIRSSTCIDVAGLEVEVAKLATQTFIEEMCRSKLRREIAIITSGELTEAPDPDGFDSEMKKELYAFLSQMYGLRASPFNPGKIVVTKMEMSRLKLRRNPGAGGERKSLRRHTQERMAQQFAWTCDEDNEDD